MVGTVIIVSNPTSIVVVLSCIEVVVGVLTISSGFSLINIYFSQLKSKLIKLIYT